MELGNGNQIEELIVFIIQPTENEGCGQDQILHQPLSDYSLTAPDFQ